MADESPLIIPIHFDTGPAEQELERLEGRAQRGVTTPVRTSGVTTPGDVPAPPGTARAGGRDPKYGERGLIGDYGGLAYENRLAADNDRARREQALRERATDVGLTRFENAESRRRSQIQAQEARVDRNWDMANLSAQRQQERVDRANSSRVDRNWDAAEFAAWKQEQKELSRQAGREAGESTQREPGLFSSRFGRLAGSLYLAKFGLESVLRPALEAQHERIQLEGVGLAQQTQVAVAGANKEFSDPLRYWALRGLSNIPGAGRLGYTNPDEDLRIARESARQAEAQEASDSARRDIAKIRDDTSTIGLPDFSRARAKLENSFRDIQRKEEDFRNSFKDVTGPDADIVNTASRAREKAASDQKDAAVADLKIDTRSKVYEQIYTTNARNLAGRGHGLEGDLAGINAKFDPFYENGALVGFHGRRFRDPRTGERAAGVSDLDLIGFQAQENEFNSLRTAAKIKDERRDALLDAAHTAADYASRRQPLAAELSKIIGERNAALINVDDPAEKVRINRAARDEALSALLHRADDAQNLNINQGGRLNQLNALLDRSPSRAETAGIVASARAEEARLRQAGFFDQAETARQIGIKSLQLQEQTYKDNFRAVEVSQQFAYSLTNRDAVNPAKDLKANLDAQTDLSKPGTVASGADIPGLLKAIKDAIGAGINDLKALITN